MADLVLIVDDDEAVRTTLFKVIRSNGIEADTAGSGEEALQKITQNPYDLILLDAPTVRLFLTMIDGTQQEKCLSDDISIEIYHRFLPYLKG